MKIKVFLVVCFAIGSSSAAFAGPGFTAQVFGRYRGIPVSFPAPASQDALANLIRSGTLPLSIGDLINLTMQNNLDIGVNRLTPLSTQWLIDTFYRPFEPTVRVAASIGRNTSPSTSQLSGAPSLSQLSHSYTVGFGQTLETGTTLAVDFSMNRTSSNNAFNTFNPAWQGTVRYSASQHLLKDRGRSINDRQIKIAQNNKEISDIQFERQVIDLVTQAQKTYWDLVFTAEDVKVKQRSMDLAEKTLADTRVQVDVGALASIDTVQAESEMASRQEQLIVATYSQTQIEDQIKKLVTNQKDPGLVLAKLSPTQTARRPQPGDVLPVEEAIRVALENRPEMRQTGLDLKNRELDVAYSKNQLLPVVDLSAAYTQNGIGGIETLRNGFGANAPIIAINRGGIGDAFGQLFGYDFTGYSVGVNVQIPLRNRAQQADYARAQTDQRIAESRVGSTQQQIALEVRNAVTQVEMNRARIDAAIKARELSERRLDAEQKKFDLGASTIRFVLEEQRNVTQAQTNEIAALVNYTKALVDYDRAVGMTLKRNNVDIEKSLPAAKAAN